MKKWQIIVAIISAIAAICAAAIKTYGQIRAATIASETQLHAQRIEVLQKAKEKDAKFCEGHLLDNDPDVNLVCGKTSPPSDLRSRLPGTWLDGNRDRFRLWDNDDSLNWLGRGSGGKLELPPANRLPTGKLFFDFHAKNPDGTPCCTGIISSDGSAIAFDNNTAWVKSKEPRARLIQSFRDLF